MVNSGSLQAPHPQTARQEKSQAFQLGSKERRVFGFHLIEWSVGDLNPESTFIPLAILLHMAVITLRFTSVASLMRLLRPLFITPYPIG